MNYSDQAPLAQKRVGFLTLGCKVNSYETDAMREQLAALGAECCDFDFACENGADVIVINTCSVTNIADRKSRQMLHRARQTNPGALIAATGCYAQLGAEKLIESGDADIVAGNSHKSELADMIVKALGDDGPADCMVTSMVHEKHYEDMRIADCEERTRAFIKIEDGCNQFCSYCIIPYARGRVRSRSEESITEEIRALAAKGYKEVVLTGIHVSSYGMSDYENELTEFNYKPLLSLVDAVSEIRGIERIRLGSLEPRIICAEFAKALAGNPKFCPYFHLSLQSGSDTTLKAMHRRYTAAEFYERCDILRTYFDRPSINTDVIVGFPGETAQDFEESRSFLEKVAFAKMHIFKYSRRAGTVADRMKEQLTDAQKHERSEVLMELDARSHHAFMESFVNCDEEVLVETVIEENGRRYCTGLTTRYVQTAFPCAGDCVNTIVKVHVTGFLNDNCLLAEEI